MFDIGWSEMLVIVVVAIIVIGPRDLPGVLRTVGKWVGKARSLSREFQRNLNDIARETEFDQVQRTIRETTKLGLADDKPSPVASAPAPAGSVPDAGAVQAETAPEGKRLPQAPAASAAEGAAADADAGEITPQKAADSPVKAAEPAARAEG